MARHAGKAGSQDPRWAIVVSEEPCLAEAETVCGGLNDMVVKARAEKAGEGGNGSRRGDVGGAGFGPAGRVAVAHQDDGATSRGEVPGEFAQVERYTVRLALVEESIDPTTGGINYVSWSRRFAVLTHLARVHRSEPFNFSRAGRIYAVD